MARVIICAAIAVVIGGCSAFTYANYSSLEGATGTRRAVDPASIKLVMDGAPGCEHEVTGMFEARGNGLSCKLEKTYQLIRDRAAQEGLNGVVLDCAAAGTVGHDICKCSGKGYVCKTPS